MGTKGQPGLAKGGSFKREQAKEKWIQPAAAADSLDRYGSLAHCIQSVLEAGAYISFGRTRDGGAIVIRVLDGDDKLTSYCHSHAEIMEAMATLEADYKRKVTPLTPVEALGNP